MLFTKLIISIFVLFAISRLILRFREGKISSLALLGWLFVWSSVEIVIIIPNLASDVANMLGIGRGADLIIYASIVLIFYLMFRLYVKIEDIEREITRIVQIDALRNKKKKRRAK